jgi:hypothetical protein
MRAACRLPPHSSRCSAFAPWLLPAVHLAWLLSHALLHLTGGIALLFCTHVVSWYDARSPLCLLQPCMPVTPDSNASEPSIC